MGAGRRRVMRALRLGDKIETFTKVTGIKAAVEAVHGGPCGGCGKRKDWANGEDPLTPAEQAQLAKTSPPGVQGRHEAPSEGPPVNVERQTGE